MSPDSAPRPEVFYVSDFWFPKFGGLERSIENLARDLGPAYSIRLLTHGPDWPGDRAACPPVVRFPADAGQAYYDAAFAYLASEGGPAPLVHLFGFSFQWPAAHAQFIQRLKNELNATLLLKVPMLGEASRRLGGPYRAVTGLIDCYIALTTAIRAELLDLGIPGRRIARISNGVPTRLFKPLPAAARAALRREAGLPEDRLILGFAGRFVRRKRLDVLVDGLRLLPAQARPLLLLVGEPDPTFGDPFDPAAVQAGDIAWLPFRADPGRIYPLMDVYVTASEAEGMSNAVLDALAFGLPVIASDVAGHRELVRPGGSGWLFECGSPAGFREAVTTALACQAAGQLSEFGRRARALACRQFDSARTAARYAALYARLQNRREGPE